MNFVYGFLTGLFVMSLISYLLNEFNKPSHRASPTRPPFRTVEQAVLIAAEESIQPAADDSPTQEITIDHLDTPSGIVIPLRRGYRRNG